MLMRATSSHAIVAIYRPSFASAELLGFASDIGVDSLSSPSSIALTDRWSSGWQGRWYSNIEKGAEEGEISVAHASEEGDAGREVVTQRT